jgi:glycosyltransferase involved in cell wall biosynthesis
MIIGIDASRAFIDGRTGTENYSYYLITEMLRLPEAHSHTFVLFTRPNALLTKELVGYTNVIVKEVNWKYLWTQLGLAWETWKDPQIDILWVPAHTLPILRNPRVKTVVTIHGLEYQWLPEYKNILQRWYLPLSTKYAAKYADRLIAVSQFTAHQLEKELHTSSKNIKVIHEGVSISRKSINPLVSKSVMTKYQIESKKYLLFVGTIQPRKNLPALIEAFSYFNAKNPEYKLVVVGATGWMAGSVFSSPSTYGVQEKVVFTGRVFDQVLRALYASASVYVQPSLTEGFGLPLLEAMEAGVPVISSDGGALAEVVGDAGVVVPLFYKDRNFVKDLATALRELVGDTALRTKLVVNGKKRVNELSWKNAAKKTLELLVTTGSK